MLAPLATRSLARRAAAITRARPATSSSAFSTSPARAVEKGPAGVPISGGDGGSEFLTSWSLMELVCYTKGREGLNDRQQWTPCGHGRPSLASSRSMIKGGPGRRGPPLRIELLLPKE